MKITFLGVGAAFDEKHTNTSMLVTANSQNILLDCGYSVPHALWKHNPSPEFLDAIWISHCHADHYFGLGALLTRMWEEQRKKPLYILAGQGKRRQILDTINMAYAGVLDKLGFELRLKEIQKGIEFAGIDIKVAESIHPVRNHSIRIEHKDKIFCYSGDGMFTDETTELFRDADLLVHETYFMEEERTGHGNIKAVAEMARETGVKKLATVHIHRSERNKEKEVKSFIEKFDIPILLPEEGDTVSI